MALQHVSGLRLRRPVAPVLVLLRAEPVVDADLLAAARDRRLPQALRRRLRHPPARPPRTPPSPTPRATTTSSAGRSRPTAARSAGASLVAAQGGLAEPKIPDIPGIEDFEGATFHSARWDHAFDVRGKRIAAVGTGASAIQFVPAIQPDVERLHVVQRTPPWIMPHPNRRTTRFERRLYGRFPALQKLVRAGVYAGRELFVLGFVKNPKLMKVAEKIARRHMQTQIGDPDLLEKVTPDYTIGCKRILPSNRWYPALGKPNVDAPHRRRRARSRATRSSPATGRRPRSTRSSSAPASRSPTCRSASSSAAAAARRSTTSGRAARRPTSGPPSTASRTSSS